MSSEVRFLPWADRPLCDINACVWAGMALGPPPSAQDRLEPLMHRPWSFLATDRDRVVGVVGAYRFEMSIPGGRSVDAVGTTIVVVLPTHRRRGLLRTMLGLHLDAARAEGRVVAGLWASETPIYPRFGFGLAADRGEWRIEAKRCRPRPYTGPGEVRLLAAEEAAPILKTLYARHRRDRAGMLSRTDDWWAIRRLFDAEWFRAGFNPYQFAVHTVDGEPEGYLQFRRKSHWVDGLPQDELAIWEMIGTEDARRGLWAFALTVDLVESVTSFSLPVDDEVPLLVEDPRRVALRPQDALWARLLDIPAVLRARAYDVREAVTLAVRPAPFAVPGRDTGTFRLQAEPHGADCTAVSAEPDLILDLGDLSALALGGVSARRLRAAGRIQADDGLVSRLDRLFRTARAPWCPERF